ncbi:kinase-like protein [Xylona heveae TC161]|uniref:non-specific serine/threonine protein kinase n=1 Tax=Xylona heveae (strain CBS 132557 / TC161) TaxID=1328760 RepID=A0A165HUE5_XYLHT|nr:kinase-like protein [Xylona heveae TC161]KZF23939.1 kinase-like protein [Xylona heveae TC161]
MNQAARSLPNEPLLEEERNPDYDPRRFYPARAGEVIRNYRLNSKLGWGTGSTITNCFERDRKSAFVEFRISQHISQIAASSKHRGRNYVRSIEDSFTITGPFGEHLILVYEPLREPLWMVGRHLNSIGLPPRVLKSLLRLVLQDLKGDNFLVPFEDKSVIEDYIKDLSINPPVFKEVDGHPIYQSRTDFGRLRKAFGALKISDFGAAVFGDTSSLYYHDIQPEQFCAPEVLLKAGWTYSADIWNLGMVLWELLNETSLLDGLDSNNSEYSQVTHFTQMIALLGPPPQSLLDRADKDIYSKLYSEDGCFIYQDLVPSTEYTFANRTPFFEGAEKQQFLEFASKLLCWLPEERATAEELYNHPWLAHS